MQWFNEPPSWSREDDAILMTAGPSTDFWRKTHYGFIRDSGHVYFQTVAGDFTAEVKVSGGYKDLYDQAGLMLRIDESNWIKCGIEYVHDVQHVSAVVTRDFSDWSVVALAQNPASIWLRVVRKAEAVEIFFSLDGAQYTLLRMAYLLPVEQMQVGLMCAAPDGTGFPVRFDGFKVQAA